MLNLNPEGKNKSDFYFLIYKSMKRNRPSPAGKILLIAVIALAGVVLISVLAWQFSKKSIVLSVADLNCQKKGGTVEARKTADGKDYNACVFANKSECEEGAFLQGQCDPGNIGISFIKAGNLAQDEPGMKSGAWYFKYEQDGSALASAELIFEKDSICVVGTKNRLCDTATLKNSSRVSVEGLKTDGMVIVRKLREM